MAEITRRQVLRGIGGIAGASAVGCGAGDGSEEGAGLEHRATEAPKAEPAAGQDGGPPAEEAKCFSTLGRSTEELLSTFDTIVVLMMENRSFDHYFGAYSLLEGRRANGLTGNESNPDPSGAPVPISPLGPLFIADPPHDWGACHAQWNRGKNDGFVTQHAGANQRDVMGYYVRKAIPTLYDLADHYVLCDAWHASLLTATWPNRLYLHGASSNGLKSNVPAIGFRSIFQVLTEAGISHANYFHDLAFASGGYLKTDNLVPVERFFADAAAGTLPRFSIVDPKFTNPHQNDDHPGDASVDLGQALIASVYNALAKSPQWSRCLFVITYDEHGGLFDHVAPPTTADERGPDFMQLGFRVPSLVIGPMVQKGCTVSKRFDHASVIATVCKRFGLPAFNARAAGTNDLSACIDPRLVGAKAAARGRLVRRVPISLSAVRASAMRGAPPRHEELVAMADGGHIPRHLDRRAESDSVVRHVLEAGARLGAVTLLD